MVPLLLDRGIHLEIVTSAFGPCAPAWAKLANMKVVVSIDGLQPEHDVRRAPATYDQILMNTLSSSKQGAHCRMWFNVEAE